VTSRQRPECWTSSPIGSNFDIRPLDRKRYDWVKSRQGHSSFHAKRITFRHKRTNPYSGGSSAQTYLYSRLLRPVSRAHLSPLRRAGNPPTLLPLISVSERGEYMDWQGFLEELHGRIMQIRSSPMRH